MKYLLKVSVFTLLVTMFSCNKGEPSASTPMAAKAELETSTNAAKDNDEQKVEEPDRKIIKTGDIHFETSNAKETRSVINKAVGEFHGYISQDNISQYNQFENNVTIRVPADKFDALVDRISANAKNIDSKNITASDVTEEYIDVEARIKTKKELEERYKQLVKQAGKMEDILTIEKEIGVLRADIESMEGRLKYLSNQVSYSTLTLVFYEKSASDFGFTHKFTEALANGWRGIMWFVIGIANIWPFVLIGIGIIALVRVFTRRRANKLPNP